MFHFLLLTAISIILFQPTQSQVTVLIDNFLQDQNFLSYLPVLPQPPPIPQNVSQKCASQLSSFYRGLNNTERWALEMFDSWSKMQSGILRGNIVDLGDFDECLKVKHVEITGKYCLISLDPAVFTKAAASEADQLTAQYGMDFELQKGICIPNSCSVEDIELWLSNYSKGGVKLNGDLCQSVFTTPKLQWDSILAICVLGIVALTAVVCSILDLLRPKNHPVIKAFSLPVNAKKLFKYSDDPNKMKFVDGLKTLSMAWIIFGHGYLLLIDEPLSNYSYALEVFEKLPVMIVISGTLSVDTFLIISGFLFSYSIMKNRSKARNINAIPAAIFHRYLRLTPLLAVVVMIHATLFSFFGSGPVYPKHKQLFVENCQRYWWSALLYIQNFVNSKNMCVPQSWYLSVDMQLYVVSLFLMVLLTNKLKAGVAVIVSLTFVSIVASFIISWIYGLPGSIAGFAEDRNNKEFMVKYYFQSYTRMAPYLIGLLLGYLLHRIKRNDVILKIHPITILCIWVINLVVLITCVFAGHQTVVVESHNKISNSFYLTFRRPAWSLAVSWVIFACALDFGGVINSILSLHVFEVFSRLSYGMYLVHYAIIQLRYLSTRHSIDLGIMDLNLRFWGFFAASAFFAAAFSLLFESPVFALEKFIFQRSRSARSKVSNEVNGKV